MYGWIVWVSGGVPGSIHDLTLARNKFISKLNEGEKVWADKGYHGEPCFAVPISGKSENHSPAEKQWNKMHTNMHFNHCERVNRRLKKWKCLKIPWRHDF